MSAHTRSTPHPDPSAHPAATPPASRTPTAQPVRLGRWWCFVTIGEVVGFSAPIAVLAAATVLRWPPAVAWPAIAVAGALEGTALGAAQHLATRGSALVVPRAWIPATAAAAVFAWSIGLAPSQLADLGVAIDWSSPLVLAVAALAALALLASIPVAQWLVLRGRVARAWRWVPITFAAWLLGLPASFAPSPFIDESTPWYGVALAFALAGLVMAAVVALVTGFGMRRLGRDASSAAAV